MHKGLKFQYLSVLALFLLSIVLGSCQQAALPGTGAKQSITITGSDYAFEAPDKVNAGWVTVTFENEGPESHHVQFLRLNDGVTLEQFQTALQQGEGPAMALVSMPGGVGVLSSGKEGQVTLFLEEGQYVLLCLVPSPDGIPHLAKGMIRPLQVVAAQDQASDEEPQADQTVILKDFHFVFPEGIKAGQQVWKVTNEGPQPHELMLLKLAPGKTLEDVAAFNAAPSGEPPYEEIGGMQGLSIGSSGWVHLNLTAGDYVALCFIPDPASGKPHLDLGMVQAFSVE